MQLTLVSTQSMVPGKTNWVPPLDRITNIFLGPQRFHLEYFSSEVNSIVYVQAFVQTRYRVMICIIHVFTSFLDKGGLFALTREIGVIFLPLILYPIVMRQYSFREIDRNVLVLTLNRGFYIGSCNKMKIV